MRIYNWPPQHKKRMEATDMTKLRKLTALLLAGVLTLLLLTACSGGGGSSGPEAQAEAEAKVMQATTQAAARPWPCL